MVEIVHIRASCISSPAILSCPSPHFQCEETPHLKDRIHLLGQREVATASMPSPPRRALIAVTSTHAALFEGGGHESGLFIGEALHPYNVFRAAGFEVDLASETGEWFPDWLSLQPGYLTDKEKKQYKDRGSEFRRKLDGALKAGDVDGKKVRLGGRMGKLVDADYGAVWCVFCVGGSCSAH